MTHHEGRESNKQYKQYKQQRNKKTQLQWAKHSVLFYISVINLKTAHFVSWPRQWTFSTIQLMFIEAWTGIYTCMLCVWMGNTYVCLGCAATVTVAVFLCMAVIVRICISESVKQSWLEVLVGSWTGMKQTWPNQMLQVFETKNDCLCSSMSYSALLYIAIIWLQKKNCGPSVHSVRLQSENLWWVVNSDNLKPHQNLNM